ncbi:MAG: hypothetical protein ACO2PN_15735, partial [Pyrobaculum sp.]
AFNVVASGVGAARLAGLYFLYGAPLLEGDDRLKIHKLAEAVRLGAEGLSGPRGSRGRGAQHQLGEAEEVSTRLRRRRFDNIGERRRREVQRISARD